MKKLIILFVILTSTIFAQSWNNAVQTTIPFSDASKADVASNKDGIHVLVDQWYPSDYLKYYLINSSGTVIRNYTIESQSIEYANLAVSDNNIYVVYKLGNNIETRKSTNAGQSWTSISDIPLNNYQCNGIDIVFGNDGLHLVYSRKDNGSYYESYYRKLNSSDQWVDIQQTTDYGSEVGGMPTVSVSTNRVHTSYNSGYGSDPTVNSGSDNTRDKSSGTWQTPQLVFYNASACDKVHAGNSKLFSFFYCWTPGISLDLYVKERTFTSSTWSSSTLLKTYASLDNLICAANTSDGKTHIVYPGSSCIVYRNYSGSSWSSETTFGSSYISPDVSASYNDVFVVWGVSNNYLMYRQLDANPSVPQSMQMSSQNNHPKILWTKNIDADINHYNIWRKYGAAAWAYLTSTTNNYYEDQSVILDAPGGEAGTTVYYKIKAVDNMSHESGYSSQVSCIVQGGEIEKSSLSNNGMGYDYNLDQNYPNPFNPTTGIKYSVKEKGFVQLKVYDLLGKEVAVLVNQNQTEGEHSVEFDAANLPSGVYIYLLRVNDFISSKKMTLLR